MNKADYVKLVTELFGLAKMGHQAVDEGINQFLVDGRNVALMFDAGSPDTLFTLVDLGGSSLAAEADHKLLLANATLGTQQDGWGFFCRWPDPQDASKTSVVYLCPHVSTAPLTAAALQVLISHTLQIAQQRFEQALK